MVNLGVPTCVCPPSFARLLGTASGGYVCSNASLAHGDYLDIHNEARAAVGSPPLTWDSEAAAAAQAWADSLQKNSNCAPSIQDTRSPYGQNLALAVSFFGTYSNRDAVGFWLSTGANYSLAVFDSRTSSGCGGGDWRNCGTYIQLVWQYTQKVRTVLDDFNPWLSPFSFQTCTHGNVQLVSVMHAPATSGTVLSAGRLVVALFP